MSGPPMLPLDRQFAKTALATAAWLGLVATAARAADEAPPAFNRDVRPTAT
jgi:hypothetical protein